MSSWKKPPRIKYYEALGALADHRVVVNGNSGTVRSSSGNKMYHIQYDPRTRTISANDNGSYWRGYLGYPSIGYLMLSGVVGYDPIVVQWLGNIPWKDLNVMNGGDYARTMASVRRKVIEQGGDIERLDTQIRELETALHELGLRMPESGILSPPKGY